MFCSQCGQHVADGSKFCNHCGTPTAVEPPRSAPPPPVPPSPPVAAGPVAYVPLPPHPPPAMPGPPAATPAPPPSPAPAMAAPPPPPPPPSGAGTASASPGSGFDSAKAAEDATQLARGIFARVRNILLTPSTEWPVIAAEHSTPGAIYLRYVAPLVAVGAIATFIGTTMIGTSMGPLGMVGRRSPPDWPMRSSCSVYRFFRCF